MQEDANFQVSLSRLTLAKFVVYLRARGWQEKASRYEDRLYFEGEIHSGGDRYQLHLPASGNVPKYRTLLQRAVYLLCGVEDREPVEIIRDILAMECNEQGSPGDGDKRHIRVRNSGHVPLRLRITSRDGQYRLLPGESIELASAWSASEVTEIEYADASLTIHDG